VNATPQNQEPVMKSTRVALYAILTVGTCLCASQLAAGPYVPPGFTSASYTLSPQGGICEERIQRIERTLEKIAKKVGVELEPRIVTLQNTRLVTGADGVTVLDESCLWPDPSSAVLDLIKRAEPAQDVTANELEQLEKRRTELLGQMLKAFDELRAADAKIEQIKQRSSAQ
jgi:hypothetical protein